MIAAVLILCGIAGAPAEQCQAIPVAVSPDVCMLADRLEVDGAPGGQLAGVKIRLVCGRGA